VRVILQPPRDLIFIKHMPLFTIPLSSPSLKTLADGIIERFPQHIRQNTTVVLSSHRAVLSLQKVFAAEFKNIVLPKILTIGDFYQDVLYQHVKGKLNLEEKPKNILGNTQRIHILLNILKKLHPAKPYDLLIDLSQSMATLLDEVILSGIEPQKVLGYFGALDDIKPHQQVLCSTLISYYDYLHKNHLIERTQKNFNDIMHAAQLIDITYSRNKKLPHPIILASTTGTIPAVQKLAKTLLSFENGYVILPGLQTASQTYPITHPLYTQAAFVKAIEQEESDYQHWHVVGTERSKLISFFDNHIQHLPTQHNFILLKAKTLLHEAQLVTTIVRHHLEKSPDDDMAIVCADPKLSLYIQNDLQKYNFQANSSLSLSIKQSVAFKFLLLYLNFLHVQDLKSLLALVKHPLFQMTGRINVVNTIHAFEEKIKIDDIETYEQCLNLFPDLHLKTQGNLSIVKWLDYIKKNLEHISAETYGIKQDGAAVFQFFDELSLLERKNLEPVSLQVFIDYVKSSFKMAPPLMNQDNLHQRVTMVGSLEARHITAPIVILTALNEGQWPPTIKNDIWLSKLDREKLGMPSLDRRLGLSAHDFASTLSAKKVYFTRSLKIDGTPTQESRWLRAFICFLHRI
jgi:ATP-dependent helicase/nuclease subunit B